MNREEIEAKCDALKAELLAEHDRANVRTPANDALERLRSIGSMTYNEDRLWMFNEGVGWFWDEVLKARQWTARTRNIFDRIKMEGSWVRVPDNEPDLEPEREETEHTGAKTPAEAALDRLRKREGYSSPIIDDFLWMYREGVRETLQHVRRWKWSASSVQILDEVEKIQAS